MRKKELGKIREEIKKENMKTVKEVYKALKEDVKIKELIEKIKSHKWIKNNRRRGECLSQSLVIPIKL